MQGEVTGTAVIGSSEKGFSGLIKIMVGFQPMDLLRTSLSWNKRKPQDLGTKMKDEKFIKQFRGKDPSSFDLKTTKDGGDIDALTGATITTRAFGEATQLAYDVFKANNKTKEDSKN